MNILQIKCFSRLANNMKLTKTAHEFDLQASTVSKYIDRIENELHCKLFHQSPEGLELTPEGEIIYPYFQYISTQYDNMKRAINDYIGDKKHIIRIAIPFHQIRLVQALLTYQDRHPEMELHVSELGAARIQELLDNAEADIGFVYSNLIETNYSSFIPIKREAIVAVMKKDNPIAARQSIDLSELAEEEFILFVGDPLMYRYYLKLCLVAGFVPRMNHQDMRVMTILDMISHRGGVTLLPQATAELLCPDSCLIVNIETQERLQLTAYISDGYRLNQSAEMLQELTLILDELKESGLYI
ncbi:MAG: LysR family transcriptional regulator [Oscillospiraceae bacterium]|nr:LysR family transcriptional regulator [Oscillospiraceae bacterium]